MKKRLLSLLLAFCLCFGMTAYAFEVDGIDYPEAGDLNVEAEAGDGTILVTWEPVEDIGVEVASYYVYCYTGDYEDLVMYEPNPGEYACEFSGLENYVEYEVGVVIEYVTEYSIDCGTYAIPNTPLTAPEDISAEIEDGKLTISWNQPADLDRIVNYVMEFYGETDSFTLNLYTVIMDELKYTLDTTEDLKKEIYTVYFYAVDHNDFQSDIAVIEVNNKTSEPETPAVWPFTDVDESHPNYEAISFVYSAGLMLGTGDGSTFDSDMNLSRAMVARILHTMVGNPESSPSNFTDVARNFWYTDAIDWASTNKVIAGNGKGQFMPGQDVTREQLSVMLYQFARSTGFDVSVGENTNILSYSDVSSVSSWAISAVQWACGTGVLEDDGYGNLFPTEFATRAEVAEALLAFVMFYS